MSAVRVCLSPYLSIYWSKNLKLEIKLFKVQGNKGLRGIPWYSEAKKDVVTDETLRGAGNKL